MKTLLALMSLLILVSCNSNSKSEELLAKTCFETNKAFAISLKKPFDETKSRAQCDCAAPILAKRCGTNCETQEGVGMFLFAVTSETSKEIDAKCVIK